MQQNEPNESVGFEDIIFGWFVIAQALFIISLQDLVFDKEKI